MGTTAMNGLKWGLISQEIPMKQSPYIEAWLNRNIVVPVKKRLSAGASVGTTTAITRKSVPQVGLEIDCGSKCVAP